LTPFRCERAVQATRSQHAAADAQERRRNALIAFPAWSSRRFRRLPTRSTILDGEICWIGADARPCFYKLLHDMHAGWPDEEA